MRIPNEFLESMEKVLNLLDSFSEPDFQTGKAALPDTRGYPTIRREYRLSIYAAVVGYLDSAGAITRYKNLTRHAVIDHFPEAFYAGYAEGGAEETEDDDERWLTGRINEELGYIDDLFISLRGLRGTVDADDEAQARADGYAATLDGVYSEGKLRGSKNKTLEFTGDDGVESCETCQRLKGKRMNIKKILRDGLIPRPGNTAFICQGYRCEHYWEDPQTGERWTF